MTNLNSNRNTRFGLLPTVVLMLAMIASFASVGRADEPAQPGTAAGTPATAMETNVLRETFRADAHDATRMTHINVSIDLDARLNRQHSPYRLASRDLGKRG
jgi:hypothetical protein